MSHFNKFFSSSFSSTFPAIGMPKGSFKKYVRRAMGGGGFLKSKLKQTEGEGGQAYLYVRSVKKNCLIFKEQVFSDKLLGSC